MNQISYTRNKRRKLDDYSLHLQLKCGCNITNLLDVLCVHFSIPVECILAVCIFSFG